MKPSQIKTDDLKEYLRLDDDSQLDMMLESAKAYVKSYTGLTDEGMDAHEDISHAIFVLVSDMYDNREVAVKNENVNVVVKSILGMYCINLL